MDIKGLENKHNIKIHPASSLVDSLISKVHGYENRHKMTSSQMLYALRNKKTKETKDICNWINDYRTLIKLRNGKNGV
jgi:hypothetical protein